MKKLEISKHEEICNDILIECFYCGLIDKKNIMNLHNDKDCFKKMVIEHEE